MKKTGQILSDLIEDTDVTIERISKVIGYSTKQISRWKNEQSEMGIEALKKLCIYFDVSPEYLLGFTTEQKRLPRK